MVLTAPSANNGDKIHQQALTAANLAFERANEREVAKTVTNGQDTISAEKPRLERRQSVRFAGPTAIPSRNHSITRREPLGARARHHPYESGLQPQSQHIEPSILSDGRTSDVLAQSSGEFGESDNASAPSSYRKLRKAKSLFSPGKAPSAVFSDGVPYGKRHFRRQSFHSSDAYKEPLRLPDPRLRKSYSFLRGVTDRVSSGSRQYATSDAAVQLARDQYLRQLEQQRLKEQSSFLGRSNRRKSPKAFRRTVRTSSTNSATTSSLVPAEPQTAKDISQKARSLSQTIKKKIKRVFRRYTDAEDTVPVQHVNATHPHYGDYISTSDGKEQRYPPVPEPDAELLLRVGSRESVTYSAPGFVDKIARPGSIRSASSDDDESNTKSRVTSWTDSTAANTINMPKTLERKRLSVIREDGGPHQPSSSTRQYEGTSDGYAGFRQPVRQSSAGRISGPIDTHRIFSALQKKIDENNRETALDDNESGTDSSSGHRKARPSKPTPRRTTSLRKAAKPRDDSVPDSHGANLSSSPIFSASAMESFNNSFYQYENQSVNQEHEQQSFLDSRRSMTRQQIAEMDDRGILLPKRPLHEVKSAFFPPSMHIERSNPSPYKRVMHASNETEAESQSCVNMTNRPLSEGPVSAIAGRLRAGSVTGSDSVYSRSSGGDTPKGMRSSTSVAMSESSGEAGTAIIITGHPDKTEQTANPVATQHGKSSVVSSGNWKNFMATQVASLENCGTHQEPKDHVHPVRDSGHKRENAQLDSTEVTIGRLHSPADILAQPFAIIQGKSDRWETPKRSPLKTIDPSTMGGNVKQNESTPTSRTPGHLRRTSNVENERHPYNRVQGPSGGLWQEKSHSSLKMLADQKTSPTTANVRYSPERAERLRRIKSSTGMSLEKPLSEVQNQANLHVPPGEEQYDSDHPQMNSVDVQTQAGENKKLVDSFLKGRRSVMRTSEESGTDPAFL